ncbi:NAD(P)/FAD-dependent oxidoreductase [Anaerocolumna sp.]|uniref:NAD(P)/FAD-dependent oxidoreductase n=1 Tax=Anaerocolumna sp. TaxID=2041569 RepID=UPI0028ACB28D|nr:NAD(P)/FAD-dependent oxidoreductase [Anaerocolumna sp.]
MSNVLIVGGGASGLAAGIFAARGGHKVTIIEHKDKIGKKILATGNGKCNYTNLVQLPECYRSNDSTFPMKVLSVFGVHETIDFFRQLGIYPKERDGYVYPNSEQAASVVQVLEMELKRLKVNISLDVHVEHIQKVNNTFKLNTNKGDFTADKVILAAGGCASPNHGSDGSGYLLAKELGHKLVKPLPALVQLKSKEKYFKTLAGVRTEVYIQLFVNDRFAAEEKGELLIANYGVSGIPIFQLSRFAAKAINESKKVTLKIDFLPSLNWKETFDLITERMKINPKRTAEESMVGLFNNKLVFVMLKEAGIEPDLFCEKVNKKYITDLVNQIKEWKIPISETNSFEQAQVSAGGVNTAEITPTTMESKLVKGLYLTGELVDVDGTCGGYNLQWAWSTGAVAGMSL